VKCGIGAVLRDWQLHPEEELSHGVQIDARDIAMFWSILNRMTEQIVASV
jgi:hypothetical protein